MEQPKIGETTSHHKAMGPSCSCKQGWVFLWMSGTFGYRKPRKHPAWPYAYAAKQEGPAQEKGREARRRPRHRLLSLHASATACSTGSSGGCTGAARCTLEHGVGTGVAPVLVEEGQHIRPLTLWGESSPST